MRAEGFVVKTRDLIKWERVTRLVPYCFDLAKVQDMSAMRQVVAPNRLCYTCTLTGKNINSGGMSGKRSVKGTKMARNRFLKDVKNDTGSVDD